MGSLPLVETTEVDGEGAERPGFARRCEFQVPFRRSIDAPRDRYPSGRGAQASSAFYPFPMQCAPFLGGQACMAARTLGRAEVHSRRTNR